MEVEPVTKGVVAVTKVSYVLSDGGRVEVTDRTLVPMGDVRAYRQLTYTHDGGNGRPACRIIFEVRDGSPVCSDFSISSVGRISVRAKDLRAFKLDDLRDDVYAHVGVFTPNPTGGWVLTVGRGSYHRDRKHVEQATRRRKVTSELLEKVAKVHSAAPDGARLEAVVSGFQVSPRQALRYIASAKSKGLIQ
jgi:hypothetical protein